MSFGYAVGDVIAVLSLLERVSHEIRNYRNAPAYFQRLQVELELARNAIQHVLQIEPADDIERANLQRIRAIAMHCLQPLQTFIHKMQAKESSLGHFRSTRSLSSSAVRLHWSMVKQADVEDLRKTILAEMVAIGMLLGAQHLQSLKRISLSNAQHARLQVEVTTNSSREVLKQTSTIISIVQDIPRSIYDMQTFTRIESEKQSAHLQQMQKGIEKAYNNVKSIKVDAKAAGTLSRRLGLQKKLVIALTRCSKQVLEEIARSARTLLDMQEQMKTIIRAIEAIPLHLTLDIIRLDDALGKNWALPYQACTDWDAFKDILHKVVYARGRAGTWHISRDLFVVVAANSGQTIEPHQWNLFVKKRMHIQQAMVVSSIQLSENSCLDPFVMVNWRQRRIHPEENLARSANVGLWSNVHLKIYCGLTNRMLSQGSSGNPVE